MVMFYTISGIVIVHLSEAEHLNEKRSLFVQGMQHHMHLFSRHRVRVKEQLECGKCFGDLVIWD